MTSEVESVDLATARPLHDLMSTRWSCRRFADLPVPHETIEKIINAARFTPSWCNTQPWHVHVTEGAATDNFRTALREQVAADPIGKPDLPFPESYEGVYQDRRKASGLQLYESLGITRGDRVASGRQMLENFELFGAPHVAVVTTDSSLGVYGAVDCGLFVNSFLLAAHSMGVATIPQAALASQSPLIREHFGLPPNRLVVVGISFGYPDLAHPANSYRTVRQEFDDVVTWVGDR
ncbi:nitroreductase [Rhodococcus erythropolis]|uniref:nitroreductase n=1 Tax=Rhodococcus erythropolis TaxID=1833 RepID=UPI00294A2FE4|nr:nitroreductase [Rhodococcus erythropolis]MDV6211960.1 nitroreductase [Rhodococcus erythropolis]